MKLYGTHPAAAQAPDLRRHLAMRRTVPTPGHTGARAAQPAAASSTTDTNHQVTTVRTSRALRGPLAPKLPDPRRDAIKIAARVLTERRIRSGEKLHAKRAFAATVAQLRRGYFDPLYWQLCAPLEQKFFQSIPASVPDDTERAYAYPDPDNKPTRPDYGDGVETTAPPRYEGRTDAGYFADRLLVWSRTVFEYCQPLRAGDDEPALIQIDGYVQASASRSGSRPMLSFICKTFSTPADSPLLATLAPPTDTPWSFYFPFKVPYTPPPFYNATVPATATETLRQPRREAGAGRMTHAVILLAPCPLFGRHFNGNHKVKTELRAEVKIWQLRLPANPNARGVLAPLRATRP